MVLRNRAGMIMSVSTLMVGSGAATLVTVANLSIAFPLNPIAARRRACPRSRRRRALPAFEIAVRGRGAALARLQFVVVHGEAHGTARLAPFETGFEQDLVEPFFLGLVLDQARARHRHGAHARRHLAALRHRGGGAEILDAAVGAGADKDMIDRNVGHLGARL